MPGDPGFESRQGQGDFIFSKTQRRAVIFTHLNSGRSPMGLRGLSVRLTAYCYIVTRLKVGGAVPVLTLYAFLACTRTALPSFTCSFFKRRQ
jgi:hypothetical protein